MGQTTTLNNFKKYVEEKSDPGLRIVRRLNATPEIVFDVFTNPKSMRIWWTETTTFDIDLRVGGQWTITRTDGEITYIATGEYFEVERPNRLKFSYGMPQFSPNSDMITIDIVADGDSGAVVTFEVSGLDIAAELSQLEEGSISQSEQGWQMAFDLMEETWKE